MSHTIKLTASFLGLKFLPPPFGLGSNSINPKLILHDDELEYRVFRTNSVGYSDIEQIDIFLFYKTTNLLVFRRDSVFTFGGNLNDKAKLIEVLAFLASKGCVLTEKALRFTQAD